MILELKAVEAIEEIIDFAYVKGRLLKFATTIKRREPSAQVSNRGVVIVQNGHVSQYNPLGAKLCSERLSGDPAVQEWFADIEINCSSDLGEQLRKSPWDDKKMIVFVPAPAGKPIILGE